MQPEALRESRDWLERAARDLAAAEVYLSTPPLLPDIFAYHAQQGAEKALKDFLAAHNRTFPLTHNLNLLLPLCETINPDFAKFAATARALTPLATEFRYPGGPLAPPMEDAQRAVQLARELVEFVRQQLTI